MRYGILSFVFVSLVLIVGNARFSFARSPLSSIASRSTTAHRSTLTLFNPNTRERLSLRSVGEHEWPSPAVMKQFSRLVRCHRTGRVKAMNRDLLKRLSLVAARYPGRQINVYSGYRHRKVSRLKRSKHIEGNAIDFSVEGVSNSELRDYVMRTFDAAGVGYYPNSLFVHLDVRPQRAFWVDLSGPGESYRYVANSNEYLEQERDLQLLNVRARLISKVIGSKIAALP